MERLQLFSLTLLPALHVSIFTPFSPGSGGIYTHPIAFDRFPRFCNGSLSDSSKRGEFNLSLKNNG